MKIPANLENLEFKTKKNGPIKIPLTALVVILGIFLWGLREMAGIMLPAVAGRDDDSAKIVQKLDQVIAETKKAAEAEAEGFRELIDEHEDVDEIHGKQTLILNRMTLMEEAQTRLLERIDRRVDEACRDIAEVRRNEGP